MINVLHVLSSYIEEMIDCSFQQRTILFTYSTRFGKIYGSKGSLHIQILYLTDETTVQFFCKLFTLKRGLPNYNIRFD